MTSAAPEMSQPADPALAEFLARDLGFDLADGSPGEWQFCAPLWRWSGGESATSWFFVTVDAGLAAQIRAASRGRAGAWGMVKVQAQVGRTRWATSLFFSKDVGSYLLPMKASVRKAERLAEGGDVTVQLMLC